MTIAAILKMFVCEVSRVVPCSCHDNMRFLLYLTLRGSYTKNLAIKSKHFCLKRSIKQLRIMLLMFGIDNKTFNMFLKAF